MTKNLDLCLRTIDTVTGPEKMDRSEAIDLLYELRDHILARIEALQEESANDHD